MAAINFGNGPNTATGDTVTQALAKLQARIDAFGSAPPVTPTLPVVSIGAAQAAAEGSSGTTALTFAVTRSGTTTGTSSVAWAVTGTGTYPASAADFAGGVLPSGTVSFAAGETSKQITVNVAGDAEVEPTETFLVTLSNPSACTLGTATSQGTITNDDVAEGGGSPTTYDPTLAVPVISYPATNYDPVTANPIRFYANLNANGNWLQTTDKVQLVVTNAISGAIALDVTVNVPPGTDPFVFPGLSDLPLASYVLHVRTVRGSLHGPWSNYLVAGPDAVGPVLSSSTGAKVDHDTVTIGVTTDSLGPLRYLVDTSPTATEAAIRAGTLVNVTTIGAQTITVEGRAPATDYYAHFIQDDDAPTPNKSNIVHSALFTTDAAPVVAWAAPPASSSQMNLSGTPKLTAQGTNGGGYQIARANKSIARDGTGAFSAALTLNNADGFMLGLIEDGVATNAQAPVVSGTTGIVFGTWGWELRKNGATQATDYTAGIWATGDELVVQVTAASMQIKRIRSGATTNIGGVVTLPTGTGNLSPFFYTTSAGGIVTANFGAF